MKIGDKIAEITKALGIKECGGCAARKVALNSVDLSKPALEVIQGLWEALTDPPTLTLEEKIEVEGGPKPEDDPEWNPFEVESLGGEDRCGNCYAPKKEEACPAGGAPCAVKPIVLPVVGEALGPGEAICSVCGNLVVFQNHEDAKHSSCPSCKHNYHQDRGDCAHTWHKQRRLFRKAEWDKCL